MKAFVRTEYGSPRYFNWKSSINLFPRTMRCWSVSSHPRSIKENWTTCTASPFTPG